MINGLRKLAWKFLMPQANTSSTSNPADWFIKWIGGGEKTRAGVRINGETALTYATVWQAVNVIAGDVSQLPIKLYRMNGEDRESDREHPASRLVRRRPHPHISAGTFVQTLQAHALMWGNGYAQIVRNGAGRPVRLLPLLPDRTYPVIKGGRLWYETRVGSERDQEKPAENKIMTVNPQNMLHIKGLGFDGLAGYSVIKLARESWGLGLSAEQHGAKWFGNYAMPSGYLKFQGKLAEDTKNEFRKEWSKLYGGENSSSTAVLTGDWDYKALTMSNEDSQFLESRKFQRSEVASWFNLPPHKVGDLERATFSNITDQNRDYLERSLMRWLVTWQEELNEKLLSEKEKEQESHYFEFMTDAFLRGNKTERTEAQVSQVLNGLASINDIMRQENMNSIGPDGDVRFMPLNITTVERAIEGPPERDENPAGDQNPSEVEPDEETEKDTTEEPPTEDRARAMAVRVLTSMLKSETKTITQYAKESKNFMSAVEGYYDRWRSKLLEIVEAVGGDAETVDGYITDRQQDCLSAASSRGVKLETVVAGRYAEYEQRAIALTEEIFSQEVIGV